MKRKFEIIDESERYYRECPWDVDRSDIQEAFVQGAKWADATMIDRACEWMMNFQNDKGEFPMYDYVGNFRKAMEE